jgi:hypothetical protein
VAGKHERWKCQRYEWAMCAWYADQLKPKEALAWANGDEESELDWGLVERPHEFDPLGFEASGAFGPATQDFLREVARVAGAHAFVDLYHWSAMVWGEHWQQRLSLVLARGQASLVLGAVVVTRNDAMGASISTQDVTGVLRDGLLAMAAAGGLLAHTGRCVRTPAAMVAEVRGGGNFTPRYT